MPAYCEVALPVPLDHTFTYGVCAGQRPQRGARVIVPFRNEKLIGVVTALDAKAPAEVEVRYLEAVLDEEPLLSEHLLELAEWTAQYYLAPLGEVLRAMLPLMAEVRRTVHYRLRLGSGARCAGERTEILASELKGYDIHAHCILPGTMETEANRRDMPKADFSEWVPTDDVARVIRFLLSDDARAVRSVAVPVLGSN